MMLRAILCFCITFYCTAHPLFVSSVSEHNGVSTRSNDNLLQMEEGSEQGRRGGGFLAANAAFAVSAGNRAGNSERLLDADLGAANLDSTDSMQGRRGGGGSTESASFSLSSGNRAGNSERALMAQVMEKQSLQLGKVAVANTLGDVKSNGQGRKDRIVSTQLGENEGGAAKKAVGWTGPRVLERGTDPGGAYCGGGGPGKPPPRPIKNNHDGFHTFCCNGGQDYFKETKMPPPAGSWGSTKSDVERTKFGKQKCEADKACLGFYFMSKRGAADPYMRMISKATKATQKGINQDPKPPILCYTKWPLPSDEANPQKHAFQQSTKGGDCAKTMAIAQFNLPATITTAEFATCRAECDRHKECTSFAHSQPPNKKKTSRIDVQCRLCLTGGVSPNKEFEQFTKGAKSAGGGASDKCVFPARLSGNKCVVSQNLQKLPAPKGMAWEAPLKPKSIPSSQKVGGATCKITEAEGIAWCSKPGAGQSKCGDFCCGCKTAFTQIAVKKKNDPRCKAPAPLSARQTAAQKTKQLAEKALKWASSCSQLPEGPTPWSAPKTLGEGKSELGGKIALTVNTKHKDCHYRTRMTVQICTSKGPSRTVNFPQADRSRASRTFKCGCPNIHATQMHTEVTWMRNTMKATQNKCSKGFVTASGWFFQRLKTSNKFIPRRKAVTKKQANEVYSWAHYNIRRMAPMMIQACQHSPGSVAKEMAKMDKEANEEIRKEIAASKAGERGDRQLEAAASKSRQAAGAEAADKVEEAERDRSEAMNLKKAALMKEKESAKHGQKIALQAERDKAQVKLLQAEHKRSRLLQAQKEAQAAATRERLAYKKKLALRKKLDAAEKQADLATEREEKVKKRTDQEKWKREKERQKEERTKERQQKASRKAQERSRKSERKKKKKEAQKIYR